MNCICLNLFPFYMWRHYFIFLQIEYKTIAKNKYICFKRNRRKIPLLLLSAKVRGLKQSWRCLYIQIKKTKRNKEQSLLNEKIAIMSWLRSLFLYGVTEYLLWARAHVSSFICIIWNLHYKQVRWKLLFLCCWWSCPTESLSILVKIHIGGRARIQACQLSKPVSASLSYTLCVLLLWIIPVLLLIIIVSNLHWPFAISYIVLSFQMYHPNNS